MKEQIYTIPVNTAFEKSAEDKSCGCPFCTMQEILQKNELDLITGASMMEPDIRIKTNEQGFCKKHYDMMLLMKNRLGIALMLESHLDEVRAKVRSKGLISAVRGKGVAACDDLSKLESSCYVCGKIEFHIDKMFECAVYLWQNDEQFRKKTDAQPFFCLPHYRRFIEYARRDLPKKDFGDFYDAVSKIENAYIETLCEDVSWFCKKFDYRYTDEPWGNSKDSIERSVAFLDGRV
ncbi:MAG: hypothetical protein J6330_04250 [Clostridia bacterium]|jgi:hypothetical protein|nr:hypothetical protein [Clostridia bacterium]MBP5207650.1 hypothetical protein [Clostridia bacterium]